MISASSAVTATMTISDWPLRLVVGPWLPPLVWPDGVGVGDGWAFDPVGGGSRVPTTGTFWRIILTEGCSSPTLMTWPLLTGSGITFWIFIEITTSTWSPFWISVPTPVTWDTWIAIARRPRGSSSVMLASVPELLKNEYPRVSPLVTDCRTVLPMALPVSGMVSGPAAASGTSSSSTIDVVTVVPAAMSTVALTT